MTNARLQKEITIAEPIGPGISPGAKLVQEYLGINGIKLKIDGDWGPATSVGLRHFDPFAKVVDQVLMNRLAAPILRAASSVKAASLGGAMLLVARKHLAEHPVEIGGQNAGPWVRYYMDGCEGPKWPWCAGFVTRVIEQAASAKGVPIPEHLKRTYSCDVLGVAAKKAGKLVPGTSPDVDTSGAVFLVRGPKAGDWVHTGIIIGVTDKTITTIEGNTNDEGGREGFEVCRRIRNRANLDVVLL